MGAPLARAVRTLASGGLVVYPTDTLLGLGARAADPEAVRRLADAKGRPPGMPVSVTVSSTAEVEAFARLTPAGRRFVRTHLPGPYTLLVPASPLAERRLAPPATGPSGTVGLRVPDHPLARELARRAGPITATSANAHGRPPCRTVAEARRTFGDGVAVYLSGPPAPSGRASQLVDLTHGDPRPVARR
ncbi:MAG TPA: L-threonylcarbamoyladenylate synthase [Thermoplasmata archaeon]|nr:L-threonylcarbamoyladenylate synthase [Thermoplasmata archaeon]